MVREEEQLVNNDDQEEGALPLRHLCTKRHILKIIRSLIRNQ